MVANCPHKLLSATQIYRQGEAIPGPLLCSYLRKRVSWGGTQDQDQPPQLKECLFAMHKLQLDSMLGDQPGKHPDFLPMQRQDLVTFLSCTIVTTFNGCNERQPKPATPDSQRPFTRDR
mmetsp:Transcript_8055/g.12781  ORF Transcript_8055/g.12781 Transcript_8055/m.12781 type:complete len:119 (+) Transcript_8055:688-1044(+)